MQSVNKRKEAQKSHRDIKMQEYARKELEKAMYDYIRSSGGTYPEKLMKEFRVEKIYALLAINQLILQRKISYKMENQLKWLTPR